MYNTKVESPKLAAPSSSTETSETAHVRDVVHRFARLSVSADARLLQQTRSIKPSSYLRTVATAIHTKHARSRWDGRGASHRIASHCIASRDSPTFTQPPPNLPQTGQSEVIRGTWSPINHAHARSMTSGNMSSDGADKLSATSSSSRLQLSDFDAPPMSDAPESP